MLRAAVDAALCGRVDEALRSLADDNGPDAALGRALITSLRALLSESAPDQAEAFGAIESADTPALRPVARAELALFTSLLLLRSSSLVRGAYHLRRAWKGYEAVQRAGAATDASLNYGLGFFLFGCSMLPASIATVLRAIGFSVDRQHGLQCLRAAASADGAYMAPLAHVMLLWVARFFTDDTTEAERLLKEGLDRHPGSPVYLFLGAYVARSAGDLARAVEYCEVAHRNAAATPQFSLACLYEKGATLLYRLEWAPAAAALIDFLTLTRAPSFRAFAAYQLGIALAMQGDEEAALLWFGKVAGWMRSAFSFDVYAARRARIFLDRGGLSEQHKALVRAELLVEGRQWAAATRVLDAVSPRDDGERAVHLLLRGQCARFTGDLAHATALFKQCVQSSPGAETYTVPHACVELAELSAAQAQRDDALAWIAKAEAVQSGYDFEKPLSRRIGALTLRLQAPLPVPAHVEAELSLATGTDGAGEQVDEETAWLEAVSQFEAGRALLKDSMDAISSTNRATSSLSAVSSPSAAPRPPMASFDLVAPFVPSESERELQQHLQWLHEMPLRTAWKGLARYQHVFKGADACEFLRKRFAVADAATALRRLLEAELIHEVAFESSIFLLDAFYRFRTQDHAHVINGAPPYTGPRRSLDELHKEMRLLLDTSVRDNSCASAVPAQTKLRLMHMLVECPSFQALRERLTQLPSVRLQDLATAAQRKAFWINVYNICALVGTAVHGAPTSAVGRKTFFRTVCIAVGGHTFSLDEIEHGILRANSKPPYALGKVFAAGDPRLAYALDHVDPRIHFALNCGAMGCPMLQSFEAAGIDAQLGSAMRIYLNAHVRVTGPNTVGLPRFFQWYAVDFPSDVLSFVRASAGALVPPAVTKIEWLPYDWSSISVD